MIDQGEEIVFDETCIPEYLEKWCRLEYLLFHPTDENLDEAKLLFKELYFTYQDSAYYLAVHVGNLFILNSSVISKFISFFPPTKIKFENSFFSEYLVKKGILNKSCLIDEIKDKRTFKEMENVLNVGEPAYYIWKDDLDWFAKFSTSPSFMDTRITFNKEEYDVFGFAALCGSSKIFKYLLVNDEVKISRNAIQSSIKGSNEEFIELLMQRNVSFDWCLKAAIEYHNNDIIEWLIENYKCDSIDAKFCIDNFNTQALCYFVTKGIDIEKKDRFGCTPFVNAAKIGHLPIAQFLIKAGALLEAEEFHGWNALNIAVTYRSLDMIKYLVSYETNIESKDHFDSTPLIRAADYGFTEIVRILIDKGANINAADSSGYTPLISASINGKIFAVKCLLEKGARINQCDNEGFTPLMHAVQSDSYKVVKVLLKNGADKTVKSKRGFTAADLCKNKKIEKLLNKKQSFVVPFAPLTDEQFRESRGITEEDEKEDEKNESGIIYGLLTNWNPFA